MKYQDLKSSGDKYKFKQAIKKVISTMSSMTRTFVDKKGKQIKLEPSTKWDINMKKRTIQYNPEDLINLDKKQIYAMCSHEIAHANYTNMQSVDIPEDVDKTHQDAYTSLLNTIEDIRVEREMYYEHPGLKKPFKELVESSLSPKVENEKYLEEVPLHEQFLDYVNFYYYDKPNKVDDKINEVFNYLEEEIDGAIVSKSTKEVSTTINKVWPKYKELLPEPPPPEDNSQPQDGGDEQKEQQEEQSSGGDDQGEGDNNEEKDQSNSGGEGQEQDSKAEIQAGSRTPQGQSKEDPGIEIPSKEDLEDNYNEKEFEEDYEDFIKKMKKEVEKDKKEGKKINKSAGGERGLDDAESQDYLELYNGVKTKVQYFKKKLNSIMVDNRLERWGGNYRSGKLEGGSLFKLTTNSTRLFSRQIVRQNKNYFVSLVIDESSSMWRENAEQAMKAACLLSEVLNKCKIPFEILGFNDRTRQYKLLEEKFKIKHKEEIAKIVNRTSGGTNLGFPINVAHQHLMRMGKGEKFIMVVTDGESWDNGGHIPKIPNYKPLRGQSTYDAFQTKHEVLKARKDLNIIGMGIGGGCDYVGEVFPEHILCDDVLDLPDKMIHILRKAIKRG